MSEHLDAARYQLNNVVSTNAAEAMQLATAHALVAIAEELAKINERAELAAERAELLETTEPDYPEYEPGGDSRWKSDPANLR